MNDSSPFNNDANSFKDYLPFDEVKRKDSARIMQTYFRSSFRVHMNLLALADRKANMMLRLNSILITAMVLFFKNVIDYHVSAIATVIIFLVTLFTSLIFATLATKPAKWKYRNLKKNRVFGDPAQVQMFLFYHYSHMDEESFEMNFNEMMKKPGLVYKSMALALHQMSPDLEKKYRLINLSYVVFIIGFALTILSIIILIL